MLIVLPLVPGASDSKLNGILARATPTAAQNVDRGLPLHFRRMQCKEIAPFWSEEEPAKQPEDEKPPAKQPTIFDMF